MKPSFRLLRRVGGVVIVAAALAACRKEVPPPNPIPVPERQPKPTTSHPAATEFALLGAAAGRLA